MAGINGIDNWVHILEEKQDRLERYLDSGDDNEQFIEHMNESIDRTKTSLEAEIFELLKGCYFMEHEKHLVRDMLDEERDERLYDLCWLWKHFIQEAESIILNTYKRLEDERDTMAELYMELDRDDRAEVRAIINEKVYADFRRRYRS